MHHKWKEIIGFICKTTNGKSYGTNSQQKVLFGQRMTLLSTDSRSIVKLKTTQVDKCMWHDFVLKGSSAVFYVMLILGIGRESKCSCSAKYSIWAISS